MNQRVLIGLATAVFPLSIILIFIDQPTRAGGGAPVVIDAILYDGIASGEPDEAVRIRNVADRPIDVGGWALSDGEAAAFLPSDVLLDSGEAIWLARNGAAFWRQFGFAPYFELQETSAAVPNLTGTWSGLNNSGDQVMLFDGSTLVDCVPFEGRYENECGTAWRGAVVQPYLVSNVFGAPGQVLFRKRDEATGWPLADSDTAVDWAQDTHDDVNGRRVQYPGWDADAFFHTMQVTETAVLTVAIAPDNAYTALLNQINGASDSIDIEVHTFENAALAEALAAAQSRGVAVTVLLEGAPTGGLDDGTRYSCQRIEAAGGACWFMISNADADIADRYRFLHAKFGIIDGQRAFVSSENFSPNSLPFDDKADGTWGRRGVVLITDAPGVVAHLQTIFASDLDPTNHVDLLRWTSGHPTYGAPPPGFAPISDTGGVTYTVRYPNPVRIEGTFGFELIQAPENAMRQTDGLFGLLARAGEGDTVLVQQLSERPFWGNSVVQYANVRLEAMVEAARRGASVVLLLDSYFDDGGPTGNSATCRTVRDIATVEQIDLRCEIANPTGLGIHNKMILASVGGKGYVHIGSLNGSEQSNKGNREVALQVQSDAAYALLAEMVFADLPQWTYLPAVYDTYTVPDYHLLISEILYNPNGPDDAEFVEIYNPGTAAVDLSGYSLSDAVDVADFEDLREFPDGTVLAAGEVLVVATTATGFEAEFGRMPDFEILGSTAAVADLIDNPHWGDPGAYLQLANDGDEIILRDGAGAAVDVVTYGKGSWPAVVGCPLILLPHYSYERYPPNQDSDNCLIDFREWAFPNPGRVP